MDARRLDLLARAFARAGSRRRFVRDLGAAAAGGALVSVRTASADGGTNTQTGVGGGGNDCVCAEGTASTTSGGTGGTSAVRTPIPSREVTAQPPFPAFVIGGTCDNLRPATTFNLIDAGAEESSSASGAAISVVQSTTSLRLDLQDLVSSDHALVVRASSTDDTIIACGNLGDAADSDVLAVGLAEANLSGYAGVATLTANGAETIINVFLAPFLFDTGENTASTANAAAVTPEATAEATEAAAGGNTSAASPTAKPSEGGSDLAEGDVVFATVDVNLRAEPSETADVVAIIGEGAELTVLGPAEGNWLPVQDASGETGYVSLDFVSQ